MVSGPLSPQEREYLCQFSSIFHSPEEAEKYLYDSWERMQVVFGWLQLVRKDGVRRVLELGANPYLLTLLMKKHFDFDLHLANFFGDSDQNGDGTHLVEGSTERHELRFSHFNLEVDRFPYAEDFFDCILFCEILEHLLLNPDYAISEIRRVTQPQGYLILTTPNASRLGNLVRLLKGRNIYDGYSPYGIYGRHNREHTLPEVIDLLKRHDFKIVKSLVKNIYPHPWKSRLVQSLRPKVWYEHLFVLARRN